jgi:hypothetical protein
LWIVVPGSFLYRAQADTSVPALDKLKSDQFHRRQNGQEAGKTQTHNKESGQSTGGKTIKSEVWRVEGSDFFIKRQDGKLVRRQIDLATFRARNSIAQGEHIDAMVNDQNKRYRFVLTQRSRIAEMTKNRCLSDSALLVTVYYHQTWAKLAR